jgi:hypothetical protein
MVDELVLHLHLRILQPERFIRVLYLEGTLEDGPCPIVLLEVLLPLSIAHPD